MDEIFEGLYLGSYYDAMNIYYLRELNIKHVINLSQISYKYKDEFNYYEISIPDDEDTDISKYFHKTNNFIINALIKKENVFCYCFAGVSRSATIILAFLIKKRKMNLQEALNLLSQKRKSICPNPGFLTQLTNYQQN